MAQNPQGIKLKRILLMAIVIGIGLFATLAAYWTPINLEREQKWAPFIEDQSAELRRLGFRDYLATTGEDRITVQSHPDGATHVIELPAARWSYVYASVLMNVALIVAGFFVWRAKWDEALTWSEGGWIADTSIDEGFASNPAGYIEVMEASSARKAGVFWSVLFALMVPLASESVLIVVPMGLLVLALAVTARAWTLRVRADAKGLRVSSAFGIRRVPWAAVAHMELVDINRERWQKVRKGRTGKPPNGTHWVYRMTDREGRELLQMSEDMAPADRFVELRKQVEQRIAGKLASF